MSFREPVRQRKKEMNECKFLLTCHNVSGDLPTERLREAQCDADTTDADGGAQRRVENRRTRWTVNSCRFSTAESGPLKEIPPVHS